MAASSSADSTPALDDVEMEKQINELEKVQTHEEFEEKINTMSKFGFSIANWMKLLFNSAAEEEFNPVWLSIEEYKSQAEECMMDAWRVIQLENWRVEKKGQKGDVVESKKTEFGKVYRFTGIVECPPKYLYTEFRDNIQRLPEWNPTILKSELIKEIAPGIDLSYQVTAGGGGNIIAPRDFVILRRAAALSRDGIVVEDDEAHSYISSGRSVQVPGYPPCPKMVRGDNKVGCWFMKPLTVRSSSGKEEHWTTFQWLMCCDLKGKIPPFVLDAAFASVMLDYIVHVRKFVAESKAKALF